MNRQRFSSGLSLIEVLIGTMLFALMAMGITKVMRNHVFVLYKSDLMTTAAALASDIASKIKTQPFNSIYSYDSGIPHPPRPLYPSGAFLPDDYLIDIDSSSIKPVLLEIENSVKSAGFDRFKIGITYLRRDSTDMGDNSFVDDYAFWGKYLGTGTGTFLKSGTLHDGCDQTDNNLCFQDLNNDGDYWDMAGEVPETPDSGLKMLKVTVYKNGEPVGVKTGTLLTKGNFSGNEIQDSQSPLKLKIKYPKRDIWVMQATPASMAALQLPTRRTYSKSRWNKDTGSVIRIDTNDGLSPVLNRKIDKYGSSVSNPEQFTLSGGGNNLIRFAGQTDPGVSGKLRVYDAFGSSAYSGLATPTEVVTFHPSSEDWQIWDVGAGFTTLSGPSYLMKDGDHRLWSRKESVAAAGVFSPFDVRRLRVDYGIPRITQFSPDTPIYAKGGLTPYNIVTISDYFKVGGGASNYSGIFKDVISAIVTGGGSTTHYYCKAGGLPENLSFSVSNSSGVASLRDSEWFSPKFIQNTNYSVTWEFGDYVGYKGSFTYTFKIPDPVIKEEAAGNTPPVYVINTAYPSSYPVIVRTVGGYTPVSRNVKYSFLPLFFFDGESGVDLKKFKLEVCRDDVTLGPIKLNGETPNCKTVLYYGYWTGTTYLDRKRFDTTTMWGAWFYTTPLENQFRTFAAATFSNPGVGVLTGENYPLGSKWKIRAYMENWAGLSTTTGDDEWRIQIVGP